MRRAARSAPSFYPNDDGKGVKAPAITFEKIFQKRKMDVDWATIGKPACKRRSS